MRSLSVSRVALAILPVLSIALTIGEEILTDRPLCLNLDSRSN